MRGFHAARSALAGLAFTLVCACSGSPSYTVGGTSIPTQTANTTVSSTTATTVTAAASGITTNVSVPAATSGNAPVTVTQTSTPPAGAPALQGLGRQPLSTAGSPILYITFVFGSNITLPSLPGFTFTLPATPANTYYYLAFFDPAKSTTSYQLAAEGPGIVSGSNVALSGPATSQTFVAGTTYVFVLYSNTFSQTVNPVTTSASSLSFSALGAANAQTFTASETAFVGTFSAVSSNPAVATVSGPTGTTSTFTVTPLAGGTAAITVSNGLGQSATVNVSVTTATFVPQ